MEALRLKEQAKHLPPGKRRETLLRKVRQADIHAHINEWLTDHLRSYRILSSMGQLGAGLR